jgi:hypothetical protein
MEPFVLEPEDLTNRVSGWRGNGRSRFDRRPITIAWGVKSRGHSVFGVSGLAGSAWQWVEDWFAPYAPSPGLMNVVWKTKLSSWSNASPIVYEDHIYTTIEPTTIAALDRKTGRVVWTKTSDYLDTLSGPAHAKAVANQERAQSLEDQIAQDQREVNRLRRDLRRVNAPDSIEDELEKINGRLDSAKQEFVSLQRGETTERGDIIGYASATPVASELGVFAVFGNGVVSRFGHDGERIWSRWLGKPAPAMRGYETGHATSPLLVDGVLIVGFGHLRGLDARTGEERWVGPQWREFGNLSVATVAGQPLVICPMGEVVRPRDGRILSKDLPSLIYLGATTERDRVYMVGNQPREKSEAEPRMAKAFRLLPDGPDSVKVEELWESTPPKEREYAQPLVWDGRLLSLNKECLLTTRNLETGELLETVDICGDNRCMPPCFSSPTAAADYAFLCGADGRTVVMPAGGTKIERVNQLDAGRANLLFDDNLLFIRTLSHVVAVGLTPRAPFYPNQAPRRPLEQ